MKQFIMASWLFALAMTCSLGVVMSPLGPATSALAASLPKKACKALRSEHTELANRDAAKHFAKGPKWAVANLNGSQLSDVRQYIEIYEQLLFRCKGYVSIALKGRARPTASKPVSSKRVGGAKAKKSGKPKEAAPPLPTRVSRVFDDR